MKKKLKIIIPILILVILVVCISLFFYLLSGNKSDNTVVNFTIAPGTSKKEVVKNLKSADLVKSSYVTLAYLFFNNELNIQAGTYEINRSSSVKEIFDLLNSGKVKINTVTVTFVEGKRITDYIKVITDKFPYTSEQVETVLKDKEFIKEQIKNYDFLTNTILNDNIYYAFEGYLFPDTYEFLEDTSIENIITTMLKNTQNKLAELNFNGVNIHEVLTKASIAELEAISYEDRCSVTQVINKRIGMGKGLGMDVTTYYAVGKSMQEELTMNDLASSSPYNTSELNSSNAGKLPIGPICNPSLESIKAALNPSDTDYLYFYANVNTREVFFANTYEEFINIQRKVG